MALSATVSHGPLSGPRVIPVAPCTEWVQVVADCSTTDNSGNSVLNPAAIATTGRRYAMPNLCGTTLLLHQKYATDHTAYPAQTVIQVFGADANGVWHKLKDATGTHEITLTAVNATDIDDGTNAYTDPVEIDLDGSVQYLVCVKTAFNGNGASDAATSIWAKVK